MKKKIIINVNAVFILLSLFITTNNNNFFFLEKRKEKSIKHIITWKVEKTSALL